MRILILTLVFPPDNVSTAQLMGDLASDLAAAGHDVRVITTTPHYNRDPDAESRQPLRRAGWFFFRSDFHGIPVLHARVGAKQRGIIRRILSWGGFHVLTTMAAMRGPRPDVILCPSPPLTIGVSAWIVALRHRSRFVYNVQEVYPDIAIRLNAVRSRLMIRLLYALERFVYRKAHAVTVISVAMRQNLLGKGTPPGKVEIIPNFVDAGVLAPLPKDNPFSRRHALVDKFVISYAGNMGPAQDLDTFLDAAATLREHDEIRFLMVGNGIARDRLEARARELALDNLLFLPHQPFSEVPHIYASSDVNLVPLARSTGFDALPSKIYRILACERPVVACTDLQSELAETVRASGAGVVVEPANASRLADTILELSRDRGRCAAMGKRGRAYVLEHFTRGAVTGRYAALLSAVASRDS